MCVQHARTRWFIYFIYWPSYTLKVALYNSDLGRCRGIQDHRGLCGVERNEARSKHEASSGEKRQEGSLVQKSFFVSWAGKLRSRAGENKR
jgi:hypothetical protein